MNRRFISHFIFTIILIIFLGFTAFPAVAQQNGPTETKGLKITETTVIELNEEINGMEGRQLRMRFLVLEPGGTVALHTHSDRPEIIYVQEGIITEYREGAIIERNKGETWTTGKGTTHGVQNNGEGPATLIVVDIFKEQ